MRTLGFVTHDFRRVEAEVDSWRKRSDDRPVVKPKVTPEQSRDMSRRMAIAMKTATGGFVLSDD